MEAERELTAKEAAAIVGEPERTVQHKLKQGRIRSAFVRGGAKRKRYLTTHALLKEYMLGNN